MDVGRRFGAAGEFEIAPARRAAADEHRVVILRQHALQAIDALPNLVSGSRSRIVVAFLVQHMLRQTEFRDLRPHHAARVRVGVEDRHMIAERQQIARHGQRGRAPAPISAMRLPFFADAGFASGPSHRPCCPRRRASTGRSRPDLPRRGPRRQAGSQGRSQVRPSTPGNTFDCQLIMYASEYFPLRDQPYVFGHRRMRRTGPLAVHHFVEVVRIGDIRRRHPGAARRRGRRTPIGSDTHLMILNSVIMPRRMSSCPFKAAHL